MKITVGPTPEILKRDDMLGCRTIRRRSACNSDVRDCKPMSKSWVLSAPEGLVMVGGCPIGEELWLGSDLHSGRSSANHRETAADMLNQVRGRRRISLASERSYGMRQISQQHHQTRFATQPHSHRIPNYSTPYGELPFEPHRTLIHFCRQKALRGVLTFNLMVKFVVSGADGLPLKRRQVSQACDSCRKKKVLCHRSYAFWNWSPPRTFMIVQFWG